MVIFLFIDPIEKRQQKEKKKTQTRAQRRASLMLSMALPCFDHSLSHLAIILITGGDVNQETVFILL